MTSELSGFFKNRFQELYNLPAWIQILMIVLFWV